MFKEIINELIGDRDIKHKKKAKITAKQRALARKHCSDNQTPQIVGYSGEKPIFKCKTKDKQKSLKMKRVIKKIKNKADYKKSRERAKDTKKFRYGK